MGRDNGTPLARARCCIAVSPKPLLLAFILSAALVAALRLSPNHLDLGATRRSRARKTRTRLSLVRALRTLLAGMGARKSAAPLPGIASNALLLAWRGTIGGLLSAAGR